MALPHRRLFLFTVVVFLPQVFSQLPNICGTKANGRYACPDCSTSTAATSNRSAGFEANLLRLQASLQHMAATDASFLNSTFTTGASDAADTVFGLAMCFTDAERSDCSACLAGAAAELPGIRCAGRRDIVLWYGHCLVRYDDTPFFGTADTSPARRFDVPNPHNFSDPVSLGAARQRLAGRMLPAAAASTLRFAFDAKEVTPNMTLHGLAQCTEDLPAEECSRCLASHMVWLAGCCADMDGVRLNGPSCYLRYEFMAFIPSMPPSMAPLLPPPPASESGTPSGRKKARTYILAGTLNALALLCLCLLGAFLYYKKKFHGSLPPMPWKRDTPTIESFLRRQHPRRYSYSQVKRMTKSFSHKLGHGGNGVVYKGRLPDGREIAVKMLKDNRDVDGEDFMTEVASISRTSHVNVVTLLGFCLQGRSKRGLIYEFMPNGSLERYTSGRGTEHNSLGWETLFDIAVGIARGLEYLHRGCNAHIVHFDIKPHNILLDRDLRPKISDFGLAKLCSQKESTIAVSIAGARGTIGYIAPEVFSRGVGAVTSKSDVYSYGMMVLEISGARRSMDDDDFTDSEASSSSKYFPQCLYEGLDQFCARACAIDDSDGKATGLVRKMVVVGLWCVQISPSDRPSMTRVLEMLEKSAEELQLPPHTPRGP
ncbi:unnamed protein product [Triticum turgidum subsp. durum]|uniref:Uncharacterized protein n=1 Tax=Triticum turgidum subsp. durum TaxID=4567 RepID=A0A9R0ZHJ8_TRITD|nr:unnamed protein product [Triticum turgidum subsp. durum]